MAYIRFIMKFIMKNLNILIIQSIKTVNLLIDQNEFCISTHTRTRPSYARVHTHVRARAHTHTSIIRTHIYTHHIHTDTLSWSYTLRLPWTDELIFPMFRCSVTQKLSYLIIFGFRDYEHFLSGCYKLCYTIFSTDFARIHFL